MESVQEERIAWRDDARDFSGGGTKTIVGARTHFGARYIDEVEGDEHGAYRSERPDCGAAAGWRRDRDYPPCENHGGRGPDWQKIRTALVRGDGEEDDGG